MYGSFTGAKMKYLLVLLLSGCGSLPVSTDDAESMCDDTQVKQYQVKSKWAKVNIKCKD